VELLWDGRKKLENRYETHRKEKITECKDVKWLTSRGVMKCLNEENRIVAVRKTLK
jgi:hypothetical protein